VNKLFVPYELALALKELGFDEPCFCFYSSTPNVGDLDFTKFWFAETLSRYENLQKTSIIEGWQLTNSKSCIAPTYQQAFEWFRIEHELYSAIVPKKSYPDNFVSGVEWYVEICDSNGIELSDSGVRDFNESQIYCLKQLIERIKK
jgi:hypothetical protein